MANRLKLDQTLRGLSNNVYFQPPPTEKMKFPCIVYERVRINTRFSDNLPYQLQDVYQVTYIDSNPESEVPHQIASLPMCVFEREFISNNRYHNVFRIVN